MGLKSSKKFLTGVLVPFQTLSFLLFLFQITFAQTLPDTAANRARGVVGCTQSSSGITCPGGSGGGGGGLSPSNQLQLNMMQGVMRGMANEFERQRQEQQRIGNQQEGEIQGYWDTKLRRQEERFDEIYRKDRAGQQDFQNSRDIILGRMKNSGGGSLVLRDPTAMDGLEVVPQNGAFGIPVLKPVPSQEPDVTSSLAPREIKIPQLPVVDPKIISGDSKQKVASFKSMEVPSPFGFKTEKERRDRLARLSDEQIDTEIKRTMKTLKRMQKDFAEDPKALEHWLSESQEAEKDALMSSFSLMLGGSMKKWEKAWKNYPRLKTLAEDGLKYLSYEGTVNKLAEDPADKEARMELARKVMIDLHSEVKDFDEKMVTDGMGETIALADFLVDYTYSATRWAVARGQVLSINENLGKPNGKLDAQESMKDVLEDFVSEQKRRKAGSKISENLVGSQN